MCLIKVGVYKVQATYNGIPFSQHKPNPSTLIVTPIPTYLGLTYHALNGTTQLNKCHGQSPFKQNVLFSRM